jgi:hypothetical protein
LEIAGQDRLADVGPDDLGKRLHGAGIGAIPLNRRRADMMLLGQNLHGTLCQLSIILMGSEIRPLALPLLEIILLAAVVTHLSRGQIPPSQLVLEHPEAGRVHIRQAEFLDLVGEAMLLTEAHAMVAIQQDLLFLPDNERITAAIFDKIRFELATLLSAEGRNQTFEVGMNRQGHGSVPFVGRLGVTAATDGLASAPGPDVRPVAVGTGGACHYLSYFNFFNYFIYYVYPTPFSLLSINH